MKILACAILLSTLVGCASGSPPAADAPKADQSASATPDQAKAIKHMREHVKYPATRDAILAACADTPEFSAAEKSWFAKNLPPGEYKSADDVIKALKF
jgi:hypothetical protein